MVLERACRWIWINFDDLKFFVNLVPMHDFEVILGMDWLYAFKVQIDYSTKIVTV